MCWMWQFLGATTFDLISIIQGWLEKLLELVDTEVQSVDSWAPSRMRGIFFGHLKIVSTNVCDIQWNRSCWWFGTGVVSNLNCMPSIWLLSYILKLMCAGASSQNFAKKDGKTDNFAISRKLCKNNGTISNFIYLNFKRPMGIKNCQLQRNEQQRQQTDYETRMLPLFCCYFSMMQKDFGVFWVDHRTCHMLRISHLNVRHLIRRTGDNDVLKSSAASVHKCDNRQL